MVDVKRSVLDYGNFISGKKKSVNPQVVNNQKSSENDVKSKIIEELIVLEEEKNISSAGKNTEKSDADVFSIIEKVSEEIKEEFVTANNNYQNVEEVVVKEPLESVEEIEVVEPVAPEDTSFEIPTVDEILYAGDSVPENINASKNPQTVMDWEVPYYDDGSNKKITYSSENKKQLEKINAKKLKELAKNKKKEEKEELKLKKKNEKLLKKREKKINYPGSEIINKDNKSKKLKAKKNPENIKVENKTNIKPVKLQKVKRPIGLVLMGIISIIVIVSLTAVTFVVSKTTTDDTILTAELNNRTQNERAASDCASRFENLTSSVEMFYYLIQSFTENNTELASSTSRFFEGNSNVGAVYLSNADKKFINYQFFVSKELDEEMYDNYIVQENELLESLVPGQVEIENVSPFFGTSLAAVFCTFSSESGVERAMILFSTESIHETLANDSINLSFIVNNKGNVLVHPDISIMKKGEDFSEHPVVKRMMEKGSLSQQFEYTDKSENQVIGAFSRISSNGLGVITEVQKDIILEGVNATIRGNIYLTIAILAISAIIIWFFATSLSTPIKALTAVTNEINQGNFDTEKFNELDLNRKDEIGVLTRSVLNQRQTFHTITRYTNQSVVQDAIRGETDMAPRFKDITVFFCDIRGFTAISDECDKLYGKESAGKILNFLDDYFTRMVASISITGGDVDKYIGDSIMAYWGIGFGSGTDKGKESLDFEQMDDSNPEKKILAQAHQEYIEKSALNAIKATMTMRYSLMVYNKEAASVNNNGDKFMPHLKMGSGLNSGRATVGNMGSEKDKINYSAIGDVVNVASRTESANKLCGTDMLITQDTYNLLKTKYIRCAENNYTISPEFEKDEIVVEELPVSFTVKGKSEKQHYYALVNMPSLDVEEFFKAEGTEYANPDFKADPDCLVALGPNGPKNLNDVRKILDIPIPDFSGVDLDKEENKVKV